MRRSRRMRAGGGAEECLHGKAKQDRKGGDGTEEEAGGAMDMA